MSTLKNRWATLYWPLFSYKGVWPIIVIVIASLAFSSYLGLLIAPAMVDLSSGLQDKEQFTRALSSLTLIFIGTFATRVCYQLALNKYILKLVQNIRMKCFGKWLNARFAYAAVGKDRFPLGEVLARIMNDTMSIRELMTSGTFGIFIDIFFVISCLIGLIQLNFFSGILLFIVEVLACLVLVWGSKYMRDVFHDVRKSRGMVSRQIANVVGGFKETFYFPKSQYASKSGEKVYNDFLKYQLKANIWDSGFYSVAEGLYPILLALMVIVIPHTGILEGAIIFAIVDLIQRSITPIKNISGKITNIQRAATGIQRIEEFLSNLSTEKNLILSEDEKFNLVGFEKMTVNIDFFEYPKRKDQLDETPFTLEKISFSAKKGELVGVVGPSGHGKSTLLKLLASELLTSHGFIQFEDQNGKSLVFNFKENQIQSYRKLVSIVGQDSHLFTAQFHFNITLEEKIPADFHHFWSWASERIFYLKKWNDHLEEDLPINQISAGEKQLIAALRAIYLKRPIVLFDEISSAMDSELEFALRQAVLMVQAQSLTIIVAHRVETIKEAHQILCIENGRLTISGSHATLLENHPPYAQFLKELSQ